MDQGAYKTALGYGPMIALVKAAREGCKSKRPGGSLLEHPIEGSSLNLVFLLDCPSSLPPRTSVPSHPGLTGCRVCRFSPRGLAPGNSGPRAGLVVQAGCELAAVCG